MTYFVMEIAMTIHISAKQEDIADTVLMPGDPYRAKWAAETFLTNVKLVNEVRGMLGFTELIKDYGVKTLIRIGSCGGMQPYVGIRDIILAMTATTINSPSSSIFNEINFAPCADYGLLTAAVLAARAKRAKIHVGGIYSSDIFYSERSDLDDQMVRHGILGVEMEAAELYTLAARYGRRALAVLTVSDHLQTGAALPPNDREKTFAEMVEIALEAAFEKE
jgi:purine-nucleoside phosphorylase